MGKGLMAFEFEGTTISSFVDEKGRDWFRGTEVCAALEISNPSVVINRVASDYSEEFQIGIGRPALYVSEPGLYALIFASKSKKAKRFQRWVFEEVLPAIRKTGTYKSPDMNFKQRLTSIIEDIKAIASSPDFRAGCARASREELRLWAEKKLMGRQQAQEIATEGMGQEQKAMLALNQVLPLLESVIKEVQ